MIQQRTEHEEQESQILAPFAAKSAETRGRRYNEPHHPYRTDFQRDRDRILYSRSFRRLEYKTQVFVNGTADHYRTRLTHTMEMTAIGRTIARALRANEDLTEAIALAHDIGHSPFGHCGEAALDELMKNEGGFDHNEQSCRWVEYLEQCYPDFQGLNLTWEIRAGLRKHQADIPGAEIDGYAIGPFQLAEAQIADVADDMAYHAHDVEDGVEAGLLTREQLQQNNIWLRAEDRVQERFPTLPNHQRMAVTIRSLLDLQVEDVLLNSEHLITKHQPQSADNVMRCSERLITFSPDMKAMLESFKAFLFRNVYWHPEVSTGNNEAVIMMRKLFLYYIDHPEDMGQKARNRLDHDGLWRTACDYVSGMTDRYAFEEYLRFELDKQT